MNRKHLFLAAGLAAIAALSFTTTASAGSEQVDPTPVDPGYRPGTGPSPADPVITLPGGGPLPTVAGTIPGASVPVTLPGGQLPGGDTGTVTPVPLPGGVTPLPLPSLPTVTPLPATPADPELQNHPETINDSGAPAGQLPRTGSSTAVIAIFASGVTASGAALCAATGRRQGRTTA